MVPRRDPSLGRVVVALTRSRVHTRALPEHAPEPLQASPVEQNKPSSHGLPLSLALKLVVDSTGLHVRHGLLGSSVPTG